MFEQLDGDRSCHHASRVAPETSLEHASKRIREPCQDGPRFRYGTNDVRDIACVRPETHREYLFASLGMIAQRAVPPMPWTAFRNLTDEDLRSIFAYLRTIPPVHNRVPEPIAPRAETTDAVK